MQTFSYLLRNAPSFVQFPIQSSTHGYKKTKKAAFRFASPKDRMGVCAYGSPQGDWLALWAINFLRSTGDIYDNKTGGSVTLTVNTVGGSTSGGRIRSKNGGSLTEAMDKCVTIASGTPLSSKRTFSMNERML